MPPEARAMKAYRPSLFGGSDSANEEAEILRLANLELYRRRASQGLPIFDEQPETRRRQHVAQM